MTDKRPDAIDEDRLLAYIQKRIDLNLETEILGDYDAGNIAGVAEELRALLDLIQGKTLRINSSRCR